MKILGRKIRLRRLPQKLAELSAMFYATAQFESPFKLIRAYILRKSPADNSFQLQSGHCLYLSDNPHDSLTVMVIFCRREYGQVQAGGVVVDIGANIGVFSLYAALSGAKRVYAFEPNRKAYETLCKNIEKNRLQHIITAYNVGISERDGKKIFLPIESSPYNKSRTQRSNNLVESDTISLPTILNSIVKERVDLCKIDCEGAEYEILFSTPASCLEQIHHLKMEHHITSRKPELLTWLTAKGFELVHEQNLILWLEKTSREK